MKRWLDRYVCKVPIKGGYMNIRPEKIIVTSNYHPRDIWDDEMCYKAIERRCKIQHFPSGPLPEAFAKRLAETNPEVPSVLGKRKRKEDLQMMGLEGDELEAEVQRNLELEGLDEDSLAMQQEEELSAYVPVTTHQDIEEGYFIDSFGIKRAIGHLGSYAPGFRPNV